MPENELGNAMQPIDAPHAQEIDTKDLVLEKLKQGKIVVHVVELPGFQKGPQGFELDFSTWNYKLDRMESPEGMQTTSTTLLMEGVPIPLYIRPVGFICDAETVQVENVNSEDSGSGHNPTNLHSLDDLREHIRSNPLNQQMNEVVATVRQGDILGLVIRKGITVASSLISFEAVRYLLRKKGLDLPVYEYDERTGTMQRYEEPDRNALLEKLQIATKHIYENAIQDAS